MSVLVKNKEIEVADNIVVSLDYVLNLENGEEIDRSDTGEPLQFLQGHGQIVPGLEQAIYGMRVGDRKKVIVAPADGYGEYDPDDFETTPRDLFPPDVKLEKGKGIYLRDSESGEVYEAFVSEIHSDNIVLDFNHPLAGEKLFFSVKISGLREATTEELNHGHVHQPGHHH